MVGEAILEGHPGDSLDAVKTLGGLPTANPVLEILKSERLLERIAARIWEEAKRTRKSDVQGVAYSELLGSVARNQSKMNDAEKLPEALRDFPPLHEAPEIAQHIGALKLYESEVLNSGGSSESLEKLRGEVLQVLTPPSSSTCFMFYLHPFSRAPLRAFDKFACV